MGAGAFTAVLGAVAGPLVGSLLGGSDGGGGSPAPPAAPAPPTLADVKQRDTADATRRRALARGGRASTILTDDSETPIGQQIPAAQIGRTSLLGG